MAHLNNYELWCNRDIPEVGLLKLSYSLIRKVLIEYIIPQFQHLYPIITGAVGNLLYSPSTFLTNKGCIALHVKSVYENVKVFVVSDAKVCDELVKQLMFDNEKVKFIGLDCEWESSMKTGVSLIQISSGNVCILYRLNKSDGGVIPDSLKELFENHTILKFGVAIQEDVKRLNFHGVVVTGFVDLRNLALRCLPPFTVKSGNIEEDMTRWKGLRSLSLHLLDIKLNKSYEERCSDWEAEDLSQSQILYAAKDAIVSLEIFYALVLLRKVNRQSLSVLKDSFEKVQDKDISLENGNEMGTYTYKHTTDNLNDWDPTLTLDEDILINEPSDWLIKLAQSLCQGIVNTTHKCKQKHNENGNKTSKNGQPKPKSGKLKEYRHQTRDKPLYENCFLLGPDDQVLATVNHSKASWYVLKNIGGVVKEEPYTVKLFFEPSGRPMPDADYYTTIKDNCCVVCEGTESFVRKMVIPHDYRKYFPLELKDHMSHDVLLLCLSCHRVAQHWDDQMRQQLAIECDAPLGTKDQRLFLDNPKSSKVRSSAKALHFNKDKIPADRQKELFSVLEAYCGPDEEITDEVIKTLATLDIKIKNEKYGGPHGQRVVEHFLKANRLADLLRRWRQHFLTNMKPKHLPPMWSVEHNLDKLFSKEVEYNQTTN